MANPARIVAITLAKGEPGITGSFAFASIWKILWSGTRMACLPGGSRDAGDPAFNVGRWMFTVGAVTMRTGRIGHWINEPVPTRNYSGEKALELTPDEVCDWVGLMSHPMSSETIGQELSSLPGWALEDDMLVKTFAFPNFREAITFITRIAFEFEDMDHHAEILNLYNGVRIRLTTHDAGNKVTEKDVKLARRIEDLSWV